MKHIQEYRNPEQIAGMVQTIERLAAPLAKKLNRPVQIMEVCGGHTHTIFKYGLQQLLPPSIEFVHGPGCPVCVLPEEVVDNCVQLTQVENSIFTSFGDALRVPGTKGTLLQAKAKGADIRVVYSPLDSLQLAKDNLDKKVIFFGLGFETTMPSTAITLLQAEKERVNNFYLYASHITIMPTLTALLTANEVVIDGFVGPGHVSTVIGKNVYLPIASEFNKPLVVSGFEPADILQSIVMLLNQLTSSEAKIENQYIRGVTDSGNLVAIKAMDEVFDSREQFSWRGLGNIPNSGIRIRKRFSHHDAEYIFLEQNAQNDKVELSEPSSNKHNCRCNEVLTGKLKPKECPSFASDCTPKNPLGALMVSSEGACAAHFHYDRIAAAEL